MALAATRTPMWSDLALSLALLLVQGITASRYSDVNLAHMDSLSNNGLSDRFSDMTIDPVDQGLTHDIGMENLWHQLLAPLQGTHVAEHLQLCSNAESLAADLPAENFVLASVLREASEHLLKANSALLSHVASQAGVAKQRLKDEQAKGARPGDTLTFSGVLSRSVQHIVEQLPQDVAGEAAQHTNGLEALEGVVDSLRIVLEGCREVQRLGQNISSLLREQETNLAQAQTPNDASEDKCRVADVREMATWLTEAAVKTRSAFMSVMLGSVHSVTRDIHGREDRQAPPTAVREDGMQRLGQPTEQLINL